MNWNTMSNKIWISPHQGTSALLIKYSIQLNKDLLEIKKLQQRHLREAFTQAFLEKQDRKLGAIAIKVSQLFYYFGSKKNARRFFCSHHQSHFIQNFLNAFYLHTHPLHNWVQSTLNCMHSWMHLTPKIKLSVELLHYRFD